MNLSENIALQGIFSLFQSWAFVNKSLEKNYPCPSKWALKLGLWYQLIEVTQSLVLWKSFFYNLSAVGCAWHIKFANMYRENFFAVRTRMMAISLKTVSMVEQLACILIYSIRVHTLCHVPRRKELLAFRKDFCYTLYIYWNNGKWKAIRFYDNILLDVLLDVIKL